MISPRLVVEVSFATGPREAPQWVDVSDYVKEVHIWRGIQRQLGRIEPGRCSIVLDNRDGRFDPNYVNGPYYPNVVPMRRLRVHADLDGNTFPLFHGYAERWRVVWGEGVTSQVVLDSVDGLKFFAHLTEVPQWPQERTDQRVNRLLDLVGWTSGGYWVLGVSSLGIDTKLGGSADDARLVKVGLSNIAAVSGSSEEVLLDALNDAIAVEQGLAFVRADGTFVFLSRRALQREPYRSPLATFGDGTNEWPYAEVIPEVAEDKIVNVVEVQRRDGGVEQVAGDDVSIAKYFKRKLSLTLPLLTDAEAANLARYILEHRKEPSVVFERVTIVPALAEGLWGVALILDIGHRIVLRKRPPYGGVMESVATVSGIEWRIVAGRSWMLTLNIVEAPHGHFMLNVAEYAKLDVNAVLSY